MTVPELDANDTIEPIVRWGSRGRFMCYGKKVSPTPLGRSFITLVRPAVLVVVYSR